MKKIQKWKIPALLICIAVVLGAVIFSQTNLQKGTFSGIPIQPSAPDFMPLSDLPLLPDLLPTNVDKTKIRNQIKIFIANNGSAASGSFRVCGSVYYSNGITITIPSFSMDELGIKQKTTVTKSLAYSTEATMRFARINVDCNQQINESDENNNIRFDLDPDDGVVYD